MKKGQFFILCLVFLITVFASPVLSQKNDGGLEKDALKLFVKVEDGIATGNVDKFSNYFAEKTFLSLSSGINGYYSSNQAYYVLKDFLRIYQPLEFRLNNIVTEGSVPFASGNLRYYSKGIRSKAVVFVTLRKSDDTWKITQITIN